MIAAPVRWPRPSRLQAPLPASSAKVHGRPAARSGCTRSASCSSTCRRPAARRARWPRCAPGEQATVAVQVQTIGHAGGAPARDAPAGGGDRARRDRQHARDVLQPAVAASSAIRRERACCCTARPTAGAASACPTMRSDPSFRDGPGGNGGPGPAPRNVPGAAGAAAAPGARGCDRTPDGASGPGRAVRSRTTPRPRASPRRRSSRSCRAPGARWATSPRRCRRPCGWPRGCPTARARSRRCTSPGIGADPEAGRGRLAFEELLLAQLVFLRRRAGRRARRGRARARRRAVAERALAGGRAAVRPDGRPAQGDRGDRRGPGAAAGDAEAADGRGGQRQDGGGAVRDAARGRARPPGGADGADRDARRAALRHASAADRRRAGLPRAAHRLDARAPAPGHARQAAQRRAVADRRHARADRARRALPLARGRGGRRAAPLRRAPARGARRTAAGPSAAHAAHDRHARSPARSPWPATATSTSSALRELPLGRQAIDTRLVVGQGARERAYEELREQLRAGRQAYVVCPLVEEAASSGRRRGHRPGGRWRDRSIGQRAATAELERLRDGELGAMSSRCCTAACARARSSRRCRRSPRARPTCWWPRP